MHSSSNLFLEHDQDGTPSWSCSQAVSKPVWQIPLLCVQWKTPDDGQRNCPKHAEFYSKNKFEKLVHLIGFTIRIYHDARSSERQFITMHGHLNVNLSRCTVTWTSIYHDARSPERQIRLEHYLIRWPLKESDNDNENLSHKIAIQPFPETPCVFNTSDTTEKSWTWYN